MKTSLLRITAILAIATAAITTRAHGEGADAFANRTQLVGALDIDTLTNMTNFTREMNEPVHTAKALAKTAWWRWAAPYDGFCTIETIRTASLVDTTITVYTGNAIGNLARVASGDDIAADSTSSVTFFATAGSTYSIAVEAASINFGSQEDVLLRLRLARVEGSFIGSWQSPAQEYATSANGYISFKLAPGGLATGVLIAGGTRYPFKSQTTADSYLVVSFARKPVAGVPLPPLTLRIALSSVDATFLLAPVEVSDGATIHGSGFLFQTHLVKPETVGALAGRYTTGLDFPAASGRGFATVNVSARGGVKMVGVTGDGQKFAGGSSIGIKLPSFAGFPIHCSFFAGDGWLNGTVQLSPGMPNVLAANDAIRYRRPARPGSYYPSGLIGNIDATGSVYMRPAAGQRALGFLDATEGAGKLTVADAPGELAAFTEPLTVTKSNTVVFSGATRRPVLKLSPATGLVTGTFTEAGGNVRKLLGILHNENGSARIRGFVSGAKRTAAFTVAP